jgi:uncharacterized protein YsxB (DUF464 family)
MTNIRCIRDSTSYQIDIEGHAEYNPGGIDLVCGAVSALAMTLMSAIENVNNLEHKIRYDYGDVHIEIKADKRTQDQVSTIVDTIMTGFAMLADGYPNNVELEW